MPATVAVLTAEEHAVRAGELGRLVLGWIHRRELPFGSWWVFTATAAEAAHHARKGIELYERDHDRALRPERS